ncbi:MAG: 3-oxoadipate enol-lactonase [Polyangiales bacterium]
MSLPPLASLNAPPRFDGADDLPVLLLINSLATEYRLWESQIPQLTPHFRVLRYDHPGHGRSPAGAPPYSLDDLGGQVLRLLDATGVAQAHVCGLSIGGLIATWLATRAPERVNRLVLANTSARIGTAEGWEARMAQVRAGGLAPLVAPSLARWFTPALRAAEPALTASFGADLTRVSVDGYLGCCAALRDADLWPDVHRIAAPTLVIAGTHDAVTTVAEGQRLTDTIRGARLVTLDAAHLSNVASPAFTEALLAGLH